MTEPNLEQEITNIFITIDNYGTAEEARVDIRKLIANQVKEARSDLVETICDIEATREAEGKDFISYKAFKRIKSLAGLDNG